MTGACGHILTLALLTGGFIGPRQQWRVQHG